MNRSKKAALDVGAPHDAPFGLNRNARTVWEIPTEAFADAHFATFPTELARRCIAVGTSERGVCPRCGAPWERMVKRREGDDLSWSQAENPTWKRQVLQDTTSSRLNHGDKADYYANAAWHETTGWQPSCSCIADYAKESHICDKPLSGHQWLARAETRKPYFRPIPALVLDPFGGSGTVAATAFLMGRRAVSIDLSYDYCRMAMRRVPPLAAFPMMDVR